MLIRHDCVLQEALASNAEAINTYYEMVSAGREFLELGQLIDSLGAKFLFSNLVIDGQPVRLSEPQTRAGFYASAETPDKGLTPAELPGCLARIGYDKYRHVAPMSAGAKVSAFLNNLMGDEDEEDAVYSATGGTRPSADKREADKGSDE